VVSIREREVNWTVGANTLKGNHHSFRGQISAIQTTFQTPIWATEQQAIDVQGDFKLLTE
jgi:hypothetical protein